MSPARQPAGVPVGGQFATDPRPEPDLQLTADVEPPTSFPRSADRPDADTWQYPASEPRFDALTAYDDVAGTYTIGDDLHVQAPSGVSPSWIGTARMYLAQLHRAGLTGHAQATGTGWYGDRWRLDLITPAGQSLDVEVQSDGAYQAIYFTGTRPSAGAATHDYSTLPQDAVDAAALRTMTDLALVDGWRTQVEQTIPDHVWKSRVAFVQRSGTDNQASTLVIRPQVGQVDTHVTFGPDGEVVDLRESKGFDRDLGTPRELALANLGRRIGLTGGRRAGVPARVEAMLTATGAVNDHPDVIWLKANQARARAVDRT